LHLLAGLDQTPGVKFVVAGDGPSKPKLERALPGARFLGFVSGQELSQVMASLDVFAHVGTNETFCQAIQEALAAGVPVVAPASGGPVDLVRHGDNGWLFPADAPSLAAPAVMDLVGNQQLRREMGRRARASVEHRSWAALLDELLAHYRRVCGVVDRTRRVA
jgi:phosphatidylinositol alpha 1,6-mannosyltransferase